MAFFGGELRECRGKRRCLNNTEGQVGSLFSVQGTVWRLEKRNKTNMQSLFLLCFLYALSVYIYLHIYFFHMPVLRLCFCGQVCLCAWRASVLGVGDRDHLCCFSFMSCSEQKHLKLFPGVILVYLHGYTQKATRRVEL